jgi:hypothetical protein
MCKVVSGGSLVIHGAQKRPHPQLLSNACGVLAARGALCALYKVCFMCACGALRVKWQRQDSRCIGLMDVVVTVVDNATQVVCIFG